MDKNKFFKLSHPNQNEYNKSLMLDNLEFDYENQLQNKDNLKELEHSNNHDEIEADHYVKILNIYSIYYKTLYNKEPSYNIFQDLDISDETATNRPLELLYEEIYLYKKTKEARYKCIFDTETYKKKYLSNGEEIPEEYNTYIVEIEGKKKITHNLIPALSEIATYDNWMEIKWAINKVNSF